MSGWRKALIGDIKMVLNSTGALDSYNDYYPFGLQMPNRNLTGSSDGRYKYTSKERDTETGFEYGVYPALGGSARGTTINDSPWRTAGGVSG